MPRSHPDPLLSIRTALVLLLATLVGLSAGGLAYLGGQSLSASALTAGGAAGGALLLFHTVIG